MRVRRCYIWSSTEPTSAAVSHDILALAWRCFELLAITQEMGDPVKLSGRATLSRYPCVMPGATTADRPQRNVYDPRVRELIRATGNPDLFPELQIPRSTSAGWLRGRFRPALGADSVSRTEAELYAENAKLKRRVLVLVTVVRLLLVLVRISGCRLTGDRLPEGKAKAEILAATAAAKDVLPLKSVTRILGLFVLRYHAWVPEALASEARQEARGMTARDDLPTC